MNRRTLLTRGLLALIALPFGIRKAKAVITEPTLQHYDMESFSVETPDVYAGPPSWAAQAEATRQHNKDLTLLAEHLEEAINTIFKQCRDDKAVPASISVQWRNIPSPDNPFGEIGQLRFTARRWQFGTYTSVRIIERGEIV